MRHARHIDLLVLVFLSVYIIAGARLVPFHGDEATLLHMSRDYGHLVIDRDPSRVLFDEAWTNGDDQMLRLINGTVSKYVFGLAWHVSGYSMDELNGAWDWRTDWSTNLASGHMPSSGLLLSARVASSLLLVGSLIALFVLARRIGGRPVAYAACLYFALNPAVLLNGRRAMMESALLLSSLLVAFAGLRYVRRPDFFGAVIMGIAAGFALSAKHTNLFVVGAVIGGCVAYAFVERRRLPDPVLPAVHGLVTVLIGAALFVVLNPVWIGRSPVAMGRAVLAERQDLLRSFVSVYGGYPDTVSRVAGAFRQTFVVEPQYFEVPKFGPSVAEQISRYERSGFQGISVGGSMVKGFVVLCLVLAGAIHFPSSLLEREQKYVIAIWSAASALPVLVFTPLEWQRYYMPVFQVVALFGALGSVLLINRLFSRNVPLVPPHRLSKSRPELDTKLLRAGASIGAPQGLYPRP